MVTVINDRRDRARKNKNLNGRRRYPRVQAPLQTVYESSRRMLITHWANLNVRGMALECADPDPEGIQVTLSIGLPDKYFEPLKLKGLVVWSGNRTEPDGKLQRRVGIKFLDIDDEALRRIASFLIKHQGLAALHGPSIKGQA